MNPSKLEIFILALFTVCLFTSQLIRAYFIYSDDWVAFLSGMLLYLYPSALLVLIFYMWVPKIKSNCVNIVLGIGAGIFVFTTVVEMVFLKSSSGEVNWSELWFVLGRIDNGLPLLDILLIHVPEVLICGAVLSGLLSFLHLHLLKNNRKSLKVDTRVCRVVVITYTLAFAVFVILAEDASVLVSAIPSPLVVFYQLFISRPICFDCLPEKNPYSYSSNPSINNNYDEEILPELKHVLPKVTIKNIVVTYLESMRDDVFPLNKDSPWLNDKIYLGHGKSLWRPNETFASTLTQGIHVKGLHTPATYTNKVLYSTFCGRDPNPKYFLQPNEMARNVECLNTILKASFKSGYFQTVRSNFDNQMQLLRNLNFTMSPVDADTVISNYPGAKPNEFNYFGYDDREALPFMKKFVQSSSKPQRNLLVHLTANTHHDWSHFKPSKEYPQLTENTQKSAYLHSVKYSDEWLKDMHKDLSKELGGTSNETLWIYFGDHGYEFKAKHGFFESMDVPTGNPAKGLLSVPFFMYHSQLPKLQIEAPLTSSSLVPTILDLLLSSHSRSMEGLSVDTMRKQLKSMQYQSLIRKVKPQWRHTILNPGGRMISVDRGGRFRVAFPYSKQSSFVFLDDENDNLETNHVTHRFYTPFLRKVREKHGIEGVNFVKNAKEYRDWQLYYSTR